MPWNPQDAYETGLKCTYSDADAHYRLTKMVEPPRIVAIADDAVPSLSGPESDKQPFE